MAITIRQLSPSEWKEWADLRQESRDYQSQHVKGKFTMQHPEEQTGEYRAWGVEDQGEIVGYLIAVKEPKDSQAEWRILDAFVRVEHRRKGYATAVHERALNDLGVNPQEGPIGINTPVQPEAQGVLKNVLGPKCVVVVRSMSSAMQMIEELYFEDFIRYAASRFLK
jgi:acetyltransferase (GNAT) family protein